MKKLMVGMMMAAAGVAVGGQIAAAASYPPGDPGEDGASQTPAPQGSVAPQQGLPATGTESQFVLQAGLVTVAAGGVLVGASQLRRRRTVAA
jgi:hypothetical protein